jgi:Flp pilus assembly pilin Flp
VDRVKSIVSAQLGQATTEYSMILMIVCLVALALGAFVKGGGLDGIFEKLVESIQARFSG